MTTNFRTGQKVHVTRKDDDVFKHDFDGVVNGMLAGFIQVKEDGTDNDWSCDEDQIKLLDN